MGLSILPDTMSEQSQVDISPLATDPHHEEVGESPERWAILQVPEGYIRAWSGRVHVKSGPEQNFQRRNSIPLGFSSRTRSSPSSTRKR